jgi:hypothetical protein
MGWWTTAYVDAVDPLLRPRFKREALASLPGISSALPLDVFDGVAVRRTQLLHDQQVPQWEADAAVSLSTPMGVGR